VKDLPILQDGPPPGGFPAIRIERRLPSTGPTGVTIFAVVVASVAYGYYRVRRAGARLQGVRNRRSDGVLSALRGVPLPPA
jgi:NADH dehydrogenase (ubiquinone) 1 alpha subcomplex subunit 13